MTEAREEAIRSAVARVIGGFNEDQLHSLVMTPYEDLRQRRSQR